MMKTASSAYVAVSTGFPARSEAFAELEQQALEKIGERARAYYLAHLDAQAAFERMKKQLEGNGSDGKAL